MATQETARPQSSGGIVTAILILVLLGLVALMGMTFYQQNQDRATYYAQQTAQAIVPAPTQPARPTTPPAPISAPIVVQTVPNDAAPQIVSQQPAQQAAPVGEVAPAPRPLIIVHHQSDDGHQTITGSGACAVGGSVARRCGK